MSDIRRILRHWAYSAGYIESELDAVVQRAYGMVAHELAEKIRAMDAGVIRMAGRRVTDVDVIADLIDPEERR
ncbi:hypothetical protein ABT264_19460 [Streptomyces virginiae]|uniref:hypothetical protein n=1 Tax=Streptomyces virginiae TaxID=1961 RepID=UPI00331B6D9D